MDTNTNPLFGGCTCGRNQYTVALPSPSTATLVFDESSESSQSRSSSLPIFLRVPLETLHSTTYSFFDDETHHDIRRIFTPRHSPHTKRQFCGFCGTPLTIWTESAPTEADFIRVSLSSMERVSLDLLEELGLLALDEESEDESEEPDEEIKDEMQRTANRRTALRHDGASEQQLIERRVLGHPWFEETIDGSGLARVRKRRGGNTSADGNSKIEWEIVEIGDDEGDVVGSTGAVKRRIESVSGDDDIIMKGGSR